ncbi:hypothetical protein [Gracilimonas mengyeensis]|uniref:Uncharacterized protein n=1 Tax=Gracilimonas mengyeensis TaxID=1302730 RepID=A0A521D164_9BACT|nr:hypothetical protein [Gracilimonas mengyeensis]SMO65437.1 hypothetical protein SAMN06265219_10723 [Gracilimonas mengyeensis]
MNPETIENLLYIFSGWILSSMTAFIAYLVNERRKTRKTFTELRRVLEDRIIHIELSKAWRNAGLIETVQSLFEIDESWRTEIPINPPDLPDQFDSIVSSVSEWEAEKGQYFLTKKLYGFKDRLKILDSLYSGFVVYAKEDNVGGIPERTITVYNNNLKEFDENIRSLISKIHPLHKTWLLRKKDRFFTKVKMLYKRFKRTRTGFG